MLNGGMKQQEIWDELYNQNLTWKKETISLPKIIKNKRVLELGVGNGKTLVSILRQKPSSVVAVDFSHVAIEKSKHLKDKVELLNADARNLPFADKEFDLVVAYYILNNSLKKDRIKMVNEIYRVLKKKGVCLFEDFSAGDFRNKGKKHLSDKNTRLKKNKLICHFFEMEELKTLFRRFSKINAKKTKFNPVKRDRSIKREIINARVCK